MVWDAHSRGALASNPGSKETGSEERKCPLPGVAPTPTLYVHPLDQKLVPWADTEGLKCLHCEIRTSRILAQVLFLWKGGRGIGCGWTGGFLGRSPHTGNCTGVCEQFATCPQKEHLSPQRRNPESYRSRGVSVTHLRDHLPSGWSKNHNRNRRFR